MPASPLIVILGQTGSGKSALAMNLARRFKGEIIAADSRTVYQGMDVGTAKPTREDQRLVPHHLLDVVTPDMAFSVATYQKLAKQSIDAISAKGNIPILVGGSGLYIDAVVYNFSFRGRADDELRARLERLSVDELQQALRQGGLTLPQNSLNRRHLIRTLETNGESPARSELRPSTLLIGLTAEKGDLADRISSRVDAMVRAGFVEEVERLANKYGWSTPALQAPGYKAFRLYLAGQISLDDAKRQFVQNDLQYAKRQNVWFKRNKDIVWISKPDDAVALATTFLNK